jgi:hypothetical protein
MRAFRQVFVARTEAEAVEGMRGGKFSAFSLYYAPFGFWELFRFPEDEKRYPDTPLPPSEYTMERFRKAHYGLVGTLDQVKRQVEAARTFHSAGGALDWFWWDCEHGILPFSETERQFEYFAKIIKEYK